jgi:hypothetical protein
MIAFELWHREQVLGAIVRGGVFTVVYFRRYGTAGIHISITIIIGIKIIHGSNL